MIPLNIFFRGNKEIVSIIFIVKFPPLTVEFFYTCMELDVGLFIVQKVIHDLIKFIDPHMSFLYQG